MIGRTITKTCLDMRVAYRSGIERSPSTQLDALTDSLCCIPTALWGQSTSVVGGPQHRSLYSDPYTRKDKTCAIPNICLCTRGGDAGLMTTSEGALHTTTIRLTSGTCHALLTSTRESLQRRLATGTRMTYREYDYARSYERR